jgi:Fe-S cluster assembly scaffold IscU
MKPIIDYYIRLYIIMFRIPCRRYHKRVIQHYESPRNVGSFKKNEKNIGTGLVGAPACGDVMKLQVKVKDGIVIDAKFKTFGCGSAIASSSVATEWIKGKTVGEAMDVTNKDIASYLSLPPVKLHCSMLAEDAIKAALNNIKRLNIPSY